MPTDEEITFMAKMLIADDELTEEKIISAIASKYGIKAAEVLNSIDRECGK